MTTVRRVHTDPRISRRRQAVARSKRRRFTTRFVVLLVLAACVWGVVWSPLLKVRDVVVIGARHTAPADIRRAVGVGSQDNILLISASDVARRAESLPWVARAEVDRKLPGTVRVRVAERRPAMVLALGAARWTIDLRGRVLAAGVAEEGLPTLASGAVRDVKPGSRVLGAEVAGALAAVRSMPSPLRSHLEAAFAPTVERITFAFDNGALVRYGAAERLAAKHEVLRALFARLEERGETVAYVDVRVPTSPAVSPVAPPGERESLEAAP